MVFYEQPDAPWTLLDFKLLEAYQTLQDEICPQCQNPMWLCRSGSQDVGWSVRTDICRASREREERQWRKDNPGKGPTAKDRKGWGEFMYTVPIVPSYRPEGTTLPTRKEFYGEVKNSGR